MASIFGDFEIVGLAKDSEAPGVFLKPKKPIDWKPVDLGNISLYSIILRKRTSRNIVETDEMPILRHLMLKLFESRIKWIFPGAIIYMITKRYLT
ncbi:MAG: hypothetical protein ACP5I2_07690 [Fervidicoccaceae archaeon]